jgi:hypothetical protein
MHSFLNVQRYFPNYFKNCIFLSVGVVDSASFKGAREMENLRNDTERDLNRYVEFARGNGLAAEHHLAVGTDLLDELVELCRDVSGKWDRPTFFMSKLVFPTRQPPPPQPDAVRPQPIQGGMTLAHVRVSRARRVSEGSATNL